MASTNDWLVVKRIFLNLRNTALLFLMLGWMAESSIAQNELPASSLLAEEYRFHISGFELQGYNPLSDRSTLKLLDSYLNREVSVAELREAAALIENEMASQGYNFHRVTLPPQKIRSGQTIAFDIDALTIGQVEVTGNAWFSNQNILASMPLLKSGETPNSKQVSNALALAKDNPAKDLRVVFVRGDFPGTIDARLSVTDKDPHDLLLWANNSGSDLSSRSRVGAQYSHRNLWGRDHNVSVSYSFSPEDTDELSQYGLNYTLPWYRVRGKANFFYSNSEADTGIVAEVFDVSGSGETYGASFTRLLNRYENFQHQLGVGVTDKLFDSDIRFDGQNIGADVRSRPASLFYDFNARYSRYALVGNVSWFTNLSGGSLNDDGTYAAAKPGAHQDWQRLNAALDLSIAVSQQTRINARLRAQQSSDRLISGEQFGVGGVLGNAGPRGFLEREVATDKGVAGSFELWRKFAAQKLDLGLFYDFSSGTNNDVLATETRRQSLASVGASLRWNIWSTLRVDIDYGYVLNGIDGSNGNGTLDDDSRWHIGIRYFPEIGGGR